MRKVDYDKPAYIESLKRMQEGCVLSVAQAAFLTGQRITTRGYATYEMFKRRFETQFPDATWQQHEAAVKVIADMAGI